MAKSKSRIAWIDALRALAIILVIIGYLMPKKITPFLVMIKPIEMPLFFIISGYLFNDEKQLRTVRMIKNVFFRMFIPWVFLSLEWLRVLKNLIEGDYIKARIIAHNFISGDTYWFMLCYMIAYMIMYMVSRFMPNFKVKMAIMAFFGVFGLVMTAYDILDFARINTAFVMQLFLAFGMLIKKHQSTVFHLPRWTIALSGVLYIVLGVLTCIFSPEFYLNIGSGRYGIYVVAFAMVVLGSYVLFRVFEKIGRVIKIPKAITVIGKYAFVIYLLHLVITKGLNKLMLRFSIPVYNHWIIAGIYFVIIIVSATAVGVVLNKICPVLVGNYKKKK